MSATVDSSKKMNAAMKAMGSRSVNFETELNNSNASLSDSGSNLNLNNSSSRLGGLTRTPSNASRPTLGSNRNVMGHSNRPGLGRSGSRSESFYKNGSYRNNSRNDLLQSMRSVRGLSTSVSVRKYSVGGMRYLSERRQIAGMMALFGLACVFQPLYTICAVIGSNGTTITTGTDFASLVGGLCVLLYGLMAVGIGLGESLVDFGNEKFTTGLLLWAQTGFISIISSMTAVGRVASGPKGFIPEAYGPSVLVNRFLGAMGVIATFAYGFAMIGSVAFMGYSLYAFQVKKPHDRDRDYYISRAALYGGVLFLAGVCQLLMGIFIIGLYGMHLNAGPIVVGFFVINVPAITALMGILQTVCGLWGFLRPFGLFLKGRSDNRFQLAIGVSWAAHIILQVMVQSAFAPGATDAGGASTVAGLSFGLFFMPFYLDNKARMTLKRLKPGYFGLIEDEEMPDDDEDENKTSTRNIMKSARSLPTLPQAQGDVERAGSAESA